MSNTAAVVQNEKDGRLMGLLSIAMSPGALLISPAVFSLLGFFFAMFGLTVAHPKQRILSIAGIALAIIAGGISYYFNTTII
jgi:hypothetical protein